MVTCVSGQNGFIPDPCDCKGYYQCAYGITYGPTKCQSPLVWDQTVKSCNYKSAVSGPCGESAPTAAPTASPTSAPSGGGGGYDCSGKLSEFPI